MREGGREGERECVSVLSQASLSKTAGTNYGDASVRLQQLLQLSTRHLLDICAVQLQLPGPSTDAKTAKLWEEAAMVGSDLDGIHYILPSLSRTATAQEGARSLPLSDKAPGMLIRDYCQRASENDILPAPWQSQAGTHVAQTLPGASKGQPAWCNMVEELRKRLTQDCFSCLEF